MSVAHRRCGGLVPQIRDYLNKYLVRVSDLFKEWDDDDSGSIDKAEFRKAMTKLGLKASEADMDVVFDSMDDDGSGSIEYKEMNKLLSRSVELHKDLRAGAFGEIELTRDQKIALRKEEIDKNNSNLLQGLDIDETSEKSVPEQARAALRRLACCRFAPPQSAPSRGGCWRGSVLIVRCSPLSDPRRSYEELRARV